MEENLIFLLSRYCISKHALIIWKVQALHQKLQVPVTILAGYLNVLFIYAEKLAKYKLLGDLQEAVQVSLLIDFLGQ